MATKYIINNEDGLITTGQTINGGISATTISADTLIISGSPIPQPSYKVYTALLTQTGTSAPTSIVLENTLDILPDWSYENVGVYYINNINFDIQKTFYVISPLGNPNYRVGTLFDLGFNRVKVYTQNQFSLASQDDILSKTSIEIRVYD